MQREVKNTAIESFCKKLERGHIVLDPDWQRKSIWTLQQKSLLIDSVLRDFEIPTIYLLEGEKGDEGIPLEVLDGQQRLRALSEYRKGEYTLSGNLRHVKCNGQLIPIASLSFLDLPEVLQIKIDDYQLSHVVFRNLSEEDRSEIFQRFQNGTPLTPAERRNALDTPLAVVVRDLSVHSFLSACGMPNTRGQHYNIAAQCLLHELVQSNVEQINFVSLANRALDRFFQAPPDFKDVAQKVIFIYNKLQEANWDLLPLRNNPLVVHVYVVGSHLFSNYALSVDEFYKGLFKFHADMACYGAEDSLFLRSGDHFTQFKNAKSLSAKDIKKRAEIFLCYFLGCYSHLNILDGRRGFSESQKAVLWMQGGGICAKCEEQLNQTTWHADHVVPYSQGGKTSIENGQVLCAKCNLKKGETNDEK